MVDRAALGPATDLRVAMIGSALVGNDDATLRIDPQTHRLGGNEVVGARARIDERIAEVRVSGRVAERNRL